MRSAPATRTSVTPPDALALEAPSAPKAIRLDLGCGDKERPGFVGVDRLPCAAARLLCDVAGTLPFRDSSVDAVHMDNVIEHVFDIPRLLAEVHRICRSNARVTIVTPHFSALASWRDPTHVHHLSWFALDQFTSGAARHGLGGGFRMVERRLSFGGGPLGWIGRLLFALSRETWEKQFCFVFRASTLRFDLAVIK